MNGVRWPVEEKKTCEECNGTGISDVFRLKDEHDQWHTTNVLCNKCCGIGYIIVEVYEDDVNEELLWDDKDLLNR